MAEDSFVILDETGDAVAGPLSSRDRAEQWLAENMVCDLLDEDDEYVAQNLLLSGGSLDVRVPAPGLYRLRVRATSEFKVVRYYSADINGHSDVANADQLAGGATESARVAGTSSHDELQWAEASINAPAQTGRDYFLLCTRCGEQYLPEVLAEDAGGAGGGHSKGRCQDCAETNGHAPRDLTAIVDRVMRGLEPE